MLTGGGIMHDKEQSMPPNPTKLIHEDHRHLLPNIPMQVDPD
jgi:hypothetical protein